MKRGAKIYYGELYCPVCGTRMVIPRRGLRKQGHIKTMFCGRCGVVRDFVEETRTMDKKRLITYRWEPFTAESVRELTSGIYIEGEQTDAID